MYKQFKRELQKKPTMTDPKVEYNFLGKCGVKVSNICLGTMTFGQNENWPMNNSRQCNEELSHQIMDTFASNGGNFLDTANTYVAGTTEKVVGSWLSKNERKKFVVATKVRFPVGKDVNDVGLSRRHIIDSLETSLESLQTNYIDLFQSHCWDSATPIDETLRTFDDLIRCGKIRYYGASNVCGWQLQKIVARQEAMGLNSCVSLQQQYNLLARQSEFEEFMVCHNEGIGVLPWSPLKGGLLTGKYKRDVKAPDAADTRLGMGQSRGIVMEGPVPAWSQYVDNDGYWAMMDAMTEIAATHGKSIPQVAIRWLLQKDVVTSVIVGATSTKQLEDNMGASTGWKLSDEEMKRLDEVGVRRTMYPQDMIWRSNNGRFNPNIGAYNP